MTEPALPVLTRQQRVLTLLGTLLAMFLAALDQTVVATAGPEIQRSLHLEASLYSWITTAYLVASTVLVPVYGKLSDLFGRKVVLLAGIVIFLAGSVACGLAQSPGQLIAFRALQGAGSASLFTSAFAVVADLFPPSERGRYSGLFGAVFGVSSLVGPLLGGFITDHFGWHWVFFVNLPIGAVALAFIVLRMPPLRPVRASPPSLDVVGAGLMIAGVVPLLLALSLGRSVVREGETGFLWLSWQIAALGAGALATLAVFTWWELRAKEPVLDLRLFRSPMMVWGNATVFVLGGAFLTPMVFLPLFVVNVVGVTATAAGLTISPLVMGIVAGNVASGQLVTRFGKYKPLMLTAAVVLVCGFAVMGFTLTSASTQGEVTVKMVLLGLGLGPTIPLYTLAIQNAAPPQQVGVTTSTTTFFRQMGSSVGIAVVGSLFGSTLSAELSARMTEATQGLPPAIKARFSGGGAGAGRGEVDFRAQRFDEAAIAAQVATQLEGAKSVAKRALDGELLAVAMVESSPLADQRLKRAVRGGGVRAQVRARFEFVAQRLEAAKGDEAAFTALRSDTELPSELRDTLARVPVEVVKDATGRTALLAGLLAGLEPMEKRAADTAVAEVFAQVSQGIDASKEALLSTVTRVGAAVKDSFTIAVRGVYRVALGLALLVLLLTLMIPVLPLRGRGALATTPPVE